MKNEILTKNEKPDFEAITSTKTAKGNKILIFGSGSKSPQRDILVELCVDDHFHKKSFSLTKFYRKLREIASIPVNDFNIEAATITENKLFLFNRGDNTVFCCLLKDFYDFINNAGDLSSVQIFKIKIHEADNLYAGFSAATHITSEKKILFTATVEKTSNWYDDGEVMGSHLGFLELENLQNHPRVSLTPIAQHNELLKLKVEGICTMKNDAASSEILMVTDSDGGASEIIHAKLVK